MNLWVDHLWYIEESMQKFRLAVFFLLICPSGCDPAEEYTCDCTTDGGEVIVDICMDSVTVEGDLVRQDEAQIAADALCELDSTGCSCNCVPAITNDDGECATTAGVISVTR